MSQEPDYYPGSYGYGLGYEPDEFADASLPEPVDDPIGDPVEEAYEEAYRQGHITREQLVNRRCYRQQAPADAAPQDVRSTLENLRKAAAKIRAELADEGLGEQGRGHSEQALVYLTRWIAEAEEDLRNENAQPGPGAG